MKIQPSEKNYILGNGFKDIFKIVRENWKNHFKNISDESDKIQDAISYKSKTDIAGALVYRGILIIAILFFGAIITFITTLVHIIIITIVYIIVSIFFVLIWSLDTIHLKRNKVFFACHECKTKSKLPIYICPSCDSEHTMLFPSVYGILKRKCQCGTKMETSFLNNRSKFDAICPNCKIKLSDREAKPICIQVIGGSSVGKTAYINAFVYQFLNKIAIEKKWTTSIYNKEKEEIFKKIENDYITGNTRMTNASKRINKTSTVSMSFYVQNKIAKHLRLLHIYDVAGEVFTGNNENEIQKQYEYCHGIVFIFDPYSIPSVKYQYEEKMNPQDYAKIGIADNNFIINSFINKLREVTGLEDKNVYEVPIAIVLSKCDTTDIQEEFKIEKLNKIIESNDNKINDLKDAEDYSVRKFLIKHQMGSFINYINIKFKNNRYFASSAIGHGLNGGSYKPLGVTEPIEWIFNYADPQFSKSWNDNTFKKIPYGLKNSDQLISE